MGELIDLQSYKEKKQHDEITALQAELAELIEQMGVQVVPMMMMNQDLGTDGLGLHFSIPNGYESYNFKKDEE